MVGVVSAKPFASLAPNSYGLTQAKGSPPRGYPHSTSSLSAALTEFATTHAHEGKQDGLGSAVITKRLYPYLVEQRIAGRSLSDIARRLGTSERQVRSHIYRAMAEYRNGRLRIRAGESVEEARKVGEEKSDQLATNLQEGSVMVAQTQELATPDVSSSVGANISLRV